MRPEFLRFFLLFVGVVVLMRWVGGGRRWRNRWQTRVTRPRDTEELNAIENRLSLMERLESRVEELENRLDFTERLLASKSSSSQ